MDREESTIDTTSPFRGIFEQYVEEASFLWLMRSIAVDQPHYTAEDVAELEQRIQAQLEGLMTSPDMAWSVCEQALELEGPGELFSAAYVAFQSDNQVRIQQVVELGKANKAMLPGLVSVFGWLPTSIGHPWIGRFLNSKDMDHKHLAIAACSIRRENPGEHLNRFLQRQDCISHKALYSRCLRLIGELKRGDLTGVIQSAMQSDDRDIVFWSSWSAMLLGDQSALANLESFVFEKNPHQKKAISLVFRVLPVEQARQWVTRLAQDHEQQRAVIQAVGVLGDPFSIDWLIGKTGDSKLTRQAGEAFSMITGIDLEIYRLDQSEPEDYQPVPNDDAEDENVAMDEDENLPWPNTALLQAFWNERRQHFDAGTRYFLGKPVEQGALLRHLQSASQRYRHAAAMELALLDPAQILINTRAKVFKLKGQ